MTFILTLASFEQTKSMSSAVFLLMEVYRFHLKFLFSTLSTLCEKSNIPLCGASLRWHSMCPLLVEQQITQYQSKNVALISLEGDVFPCLSPVLIIKADFTHWRASSRHHIITTLLRADLIVHDGDLVAVFLSVPSACQWQANLQPLFQACKV